MEKKAEKVVDGRRQLYFYLVERLELDELPELLLDKLRFSWSMSL